MRKKKEVLFTLHVIMFLKQEVIIFIYLCALEMEEAVLTV